LSHDLSDARVSPAGSLPIVRRRLDWEVLLELRDSACRRHVQYLLGAAHARRKVLSPMRHAGGDGIIR
jgi:hypothetical protein